MRIRWNLKETENIIYEKKKKKKQRKSQKISGEPHLPLPGQLPLRSGWSRYYRPPTCTEPLKLRESPSAPEVETEERERVERVSRLDYSSSKTVFTAGSVCAFQLTAVWAVMWVQPTTFAPARGFSPCARFLSAIRAGISGKEQREMRRRSHTYRWMKEFIPGVTKTPWGSELKIKKWKIKENTFFCLTLFSD